MSVRPNSAQHAIRQLKLVLPGGVITYYLGTLHEFWRVTQFKDSWGRTAAFGALVLGITTIMLFIYVLLTPWIKGVEPNYRSWRESGILSSVIPILTTTIVVGLLFLVVTLGQWTGLGYLRGTIGAIALYVLIFGLLGLVPVPKVHRT
ncbi:hypothetical protein E4T56_gene3331 [Termitomyces sp. T112]|nr:hypothetical protein E4T56_gene3331 [Termitomyces sp. T112]KNZ81906.1 hypothetical protein J132_10185 [Termitomyces sp. J132]